MLLVKDFLVAYKLRCPVLPLADNCTFQAVIMYRLSSTAVMTQYCSYLLRHFRHIASLILNSAPVKVLNCIRPGFFVSLPLQQIPLPYSSFFSLYSLCFVAWLIPSSFLISSMWL